MKCIFFSFAVLLVGCNSLKYSTESEFNLKKHSFSYSEISDSSLISKKVQINFIPDSVLVGKIIGISDKQLTIVTQRTLDTLSVSFMEIKSFQVFGFPLVFYHRNSFGYGFGGTFSVLITPYIVSTINATYNTYNQTPEMTMAYLGVSFISGVLFAHFLKYDEEELESEIVTVYVK